MPSAQKVVSITLYPVYPDGYSNAVRALLQVKLKQAWTDKLESDWYAMDCSSLTTPATIFHKCDTIVQSTNFSGGGGPASATAYDPGNGWSNVGNLHEAKREIQYSNNNQTWQVGVTYQGAQYAAEVHAVYRLSAVKTLP